MLINLWLEKYHSTTLQEAYEKTPWSDSLEFYHMFKCTQEQHDKWNIEVKEIFRKHFKFKKKIADRYWGLTYLNCSPMIINEKNIKDK